MERILGEGLNFSKLENLFFRIRFSNEWLVLFSFLS